MRTKRGFSLLELMIVVAIAGILLSIAIVAIPRNRFAVNQGAKFVTSQLTRARFEAIKRNDPAGIYFDSSGNGRYVVFVDDNGSDSYDAGEPVVNETVFGAGELGDVTLELVKCADYESAETAAAIVFDSRGVYQQATARAVKIENSGGSYAKYVRINAMGRTEVTEVCS